VNFAVALFGMNHYIYIFAVYNNFGHPLGGKITRSGYIFNTG